MIFEDIGYPPYSIFPAHFGMIQEEFIFFNTAAVRHLAFVGRILDDPQ